MGRPDGRMTEKRRAFVIEYVSDRNGTAAAIRAGYPMRSAGKIAHELLRQPTVRREVDKLLTELAQRTLISAERVLLDINDIADNARAAGEFNAALKGKELLGKHYKLFTEKHEHGGLGGGPVQFQITDSEANL